MTGSEPIYLTPFKKMTTNNMMTQPDAKSMSVSVEIDAIAYPSLSLNDRIGSNVDIMHKQTQALDHVTPPPDNTDSMASKKIKATSIITNENIIPDHAKWIQTPSKNTETSQSISMTHTSTFSDENNYNEPKKYYGQLNVPTPFKDALFWPETPSSSSPKAKVKLPSVITSERWQIFTKK